MSKPVAASAVAVLLGLSLACAPATPPPPADVILVNARAYTMSWPDPALDGTPAGQSPHTASGWTPDAQAVALTGGRITLVGTREAVEARTGPSTEVIDLGGATLLPGMVDSHAHVLELGAKLQAVDLAGVASEAEAVDRVVAYAVNVPKGQWITGRGWDEGAWANRYPDWRLLSQKVPDHPVMLYSLHGFAVWTNRLALDSAKITRRTSAPVGGEIRKDAAGEPTGIFLNRATTIMVAAVPPPTAEQLEGQLLAGLNEMARSGYVAIHEAGVDRATLAGLMALDAKGQLPIRVYAMLSARDPELCREWAATGPQGAPGDMLVVRAVKAYYDGALGSRGARLIDDYSDMKGHRGISGAGYGFDQDVVAAMMRAGFQVGVHAIGDAGNRETLDFFEGVLKDSERARQGRHRVEHAQVVSPADMPRFSRMGIIASMEPPHAVEDMAWAETRLGPERVKGAYAWRTLRENGTRLIFNSDLTGSDHNLFYGLHSAITRQDKDGQPGGGWYPEQRMTPEEAVRGYSTWAAYASFAEGDTGQLVPGRLADLTALSVDPLTLGATDPGQLLVGRVRLTVVRGKVVFDGR
ncbi:MAG TPA: amidohydrolase [Vicinamibacterales bacterium]|nr:amidohydrolase [Vicinamibacterales bacterium]